MSLRYEDVADIVRAIEASSLDELIVETAEMKLVLRRRGAGQRPLPETDESGERDASAQGNARSPLPPAPAPPPTSITATADAPVEGGVVRSPMIGTFYRAPSPDAAPFVEVGSEVRAGDPLCLIEVMKLFTTLYAKEAGRVVQINARDGEFVEYGRVLFRLDVA
jgi:acetyl-CoA carboxylase biotin carboxyl carrier protein